MKDLSAIYTREWFVKDFDHPGVRSDHHLCADGIFREFRPTFAYDYGCGPGYIIERLQQLGVIVYGYEGSIHGLNHATDAIRSHIEHRDLTTMWPSARIPSPNGVIICTEVAEHLEAEHADHLVELLCAHMAPIVFTAATPGQGGHDHVNEQPRDYWIDKFQRRGALYDATLTSNLGARWDRVTQIKCMPKNVMVFS